MRRILLGLLPKILLSRTTGLLTHIPVPRSLRRHYYGWFARRYGAELDQVEGELADYRSLAAFFQRALRDGARPIADAELVWPCDGKIVSAGPIAAGRIEQIKGVDYAVEELLGAELDAATQGTIYLAPGDYHRVHSPIRGTLTAIRPIRGTLFPVNPPAVRAIPQLFVRNARVVFDYAFADGRRAAVVMVGALNVGDIGVTAKVGDEVAPGDEIGRFGFGSTVVAVLPSGEPAFPEVAAETVVRMGQAAD